MSHICGALEGAIGDDFHDVVVEDVGGRWCGQWVLLIGRRFLVFTIHVFQLFVNLFGGAIEFA